VLGTRSEEVKPALNFSHRWSLNTPTSNCSSQSYQTWQ